MPSPAKGPRALIGSRVPPEHKQVYAAAAARLGLDVSDYLALLLADFHKLDRPAWFSRGKRPLDLPLFEFDAKTGQIVARGTDDEESTTKAS